MSIEIIKPDSRINFIGNRNIAFLISGILIFISIVSILAHRGLNLGVDFKGGLLVQVRFDDQNLSQDALRANLLDAGLDVSSIQDFGESGDNEYLIQFQNPRGAIDESLINEVLSTLETSFGAANYEVRRQEMVGPKVGADLRQKALYAIYYAILMIIIYISG
ncbi:MAG: protein translocase subunit SecF, partial [Deltaproteobacteria bacterium]|nr:protein translocase subunit SecF [Deltaproteobacteria bacterium]